MGPDEHSCKAELPATIVIADKGYDGGLKKLEQAGKTAVIPPRANRKQQRLYDKDLYKATPLDREPLRQTQTVPSHRHTIR
jgi:hypothetical protein